MEDPQKPPSPASRVLVVDNSAIVRQTVSSVLTPLGVVVDQAEDGDQALRSITRQRPDLVILDLRMPERDGLETLAAIRGDDATRDLPVFILTAAMDAEARERGAVLRADGYLLKSELNPSDLRRRVERYLGVPALSRDWDQELALMEVLVVMGGHGDEIDVIRSLGAWGCGVIPCDTMKDALGFVDAAVDVILVGESAVKGQLPAVEQLDVQRRNDGVVVPMVLLTLEGAENEASGVDASRALFDAALSLPLQSGALRQTLRQLVLGVDSEAAPLTRERLLRHADGSLELAKEMVDITERDAPPVVEAMRAAAEAHDLESFSYQSHELRGMLDLLGASKLARAVQRLERRAAGGKTIESPWMARLEEELRQLLEQLRGFVEA